MKTVCEPSLKYFHTLTLTSLYKFDIAKFQYSKPEFVHKYKFMHSYYSLNQFNSFKVAFNIWQ